MTPQALREQIVALHAKHGEAHRQMVAALEANDLLGLVSASQEQGSLCAEQGVVLADYVAARVAEMPELDVTDRERVKELASQLRDERLETRKKVAG